MAQRHLSEWNVAHNDLEATLKYVVLAADSDASFQFLLPITSVLWAERTIYKPLVLTTRINKCLTTLAKEGTIELKIIGTEITRNLMSIKLTRWYSWQHVKAEDDLFLMDADLWPIDGEFHNPKTVKEVTLYYADAYKGKMYSTAAILAKASALKEITKGESVSHRLKECEKYPADWEGHHSDDCAQSLLLLKWSGYPAKCHMIDRGPSPPKTRIDRSDWPKTFTNKLLEGKVDAHIPRECCDLRVWQMVEPLFTLLAPNRNEWVKNWRAEWAGQQDD